MHGYSILKIISSLKKRYAELWDDIFSDGFTHEVEQLEDLQSFLKRKGGILHSGNIDITFVFKVYELLKYNFDSFENDTLTRENFIDPQQYSFKIDWSESYRESGMISGTVSYDAADAEMARLAADFDMYEGYFEKDEDDREVFDYYSDNFVLGDAKKINESIKVSVKKALKEQYLLFIRKQI
jgi:hypothetical protein